MVRVEVAFAAEEYSEGGCLRCGGGKLIVVAVVNLSNGDQVDR